MQLDPHDVVNPKVTSVSEWWINLKEKQKLESKSLNYSNS